MEALFQKIAKIRFLQNFLIRSIVYLHNSAYKALAQLATIRNNGIHPKHRIQNYHQFFVDNIDPSDVVLDLGCGNGANAYDIAEHARKVIGIEIHGGNVAFAKKRYSRENLEYVHGDALQYQPEESIQVIVLSNVLEHIDERVKFLQGVRSIAPKMLLRVPMITRDWLAVWKKEQGLEYRLDGTHYIEFTLQNLLQEIDEGGWTVESYSIQFGEFWGVLRRK